MLPLGNSSTAQKVSSLVVGMEEKAKIKVDPCKIGTDGSSSDCPVVPSVTDADGEPEWEKILSLFDRAMVLGANMDLDLANAYYIYIMAALYFSVPAVTGQLVLGAKAGAAGMVSNMIGGVASEGGRAAGQGFTGLLGKHAGANAATVGQEGYAKAMRKSGLGLQAVNSGNLGLESALAGAEAQTQGQNLGLIASNKDRATQTYQTQANAAAALGALRSGMVGNPLAHGMLSLLNKGGLRPISMPDSAIGHLKPKSDGKGVKAAPGASGATGGSEGATGSIGFLGGLWGQTHQILGEAGRVGATLVSADAVANTNAALAGYNAQQGQINLNSFGQNTAREGFGMAERRVGAQADFDAQQSAWGARRDFANQTAGYLGALGMDTSFLGPGPKPQDMTGMAMSGMLGASATRSAHFANPQTGAFWGMRDATFNNLYSGFGPGRIQSAYTSTSFGEAARDVEDGLNYTWGTYKGGNIGGTKLPSE
ncbi:MAG: hypothetical protein DCC75_11595 [Proteobacteria bacterium]|nr:MAG: hypothetical protein DCC75_11595 [Pseudomonadota bacterium]